MKKLLTLIIIIGLFTSCTRYTVDGVTSGGCGVWYEKKFKPNKVPKQRNIHNRMPVIH